MKPGDHPDFFRLAPPEGRSRESTIVLDRDGYFHHEGARVEHPKLAAAMHTWISRHPDDGRYILTNGYDWTYFTVEDAPFTVTTLRHDGDRIVLLLSDETEEMLDPARCREGDGGAIYTKVKVHDPRGPFEAKLSRHAQTLLLPFLIEQDGRIGIEQNHAFSPFPWFG